MAVDLEMDFEMDFEMDRLQGRVSLGWLRCVGYICEVVCWAS
jgi:hypothetical protein